MKTYKLILNLVSFIIISSVFAQTAYYDALKLNQLEKVSLPNGKLKFTFKDTVQLQRILINYVEAKTYNQLAEDFNENPFFTLPSSASQSVNDNSTPLDGLKSESFTGGISGLNVTNFADGLAKFLVKRTKEELNIAFFGKFKEILENYPEFKALFPKTHSFISLIEEQNYASMLQILKQAFEDDIKNMIHNIPNLRNCKCKDLSNENCNERVKKITGFFEKEGGWAVWTMSLFVDELVNGKNVADALSSVFDDTDLEKVDSNNNNDPLVYNVFKLLDLFSSSLRNEDDSKIWVSSKDIKKEIIENDIQRTIYLGLLYQQSKMRNIRFTVKGSSQLIYFHKILEQFKDSQDKLKPFLLGLSETITKIEMSLENLKELRLENKSLNTRTINNYLTGINELFEDTSGLMDVIGQKDSIKTDITKLTNSLQYATGILNDLEEKNYGSLIFNVTILLDNYMGNEFAFKKELIKYGTFMATVAQAENSDQVAAAIEAVALPSGSSSIKRKSKSNVALNAYVGLSPGIEHSGDTGKSEFSLGVNAPIGMAFSWGNYCSAKKKETGASTTLFLTLIDLGAITTFRFGDNETENIPEIKLENIFAPGLYYVYGIRNSPVSIGLGGQLGPQLRKITDETIDLQSKATFSLKFFIAVDIPLLNFYTKSR